MSRRGKPRSKIAMSCRLYLELHGGDGVTEGRHDGKEAVLGAEAEEIHHVLGSLQCVPRFTFVFLVYSIVDVFDEVQ